MPHSIERTLLIHIPMGMTTTWAWTGQLPDLTSHFAPLHGGVVCRANVEGCDLRRLAGGLSSWYCTLPSGHSLRYPHLAGNRRHILALWYEGQETPLERRMAMAEAFNPTAAEFTWWGQLESRSFSQTRIGSEVECGALIPQSAPRTHMGIRCNRPLGHCVMYPHLYSSRLRGLAVWYDEEAYRIAEGRS